MLCHLSQQCLFFLISYTTTFTFHILQLLLLSPDGHLASMMSLTLVAPLSSAQLRLVGKLNNLRIELL